LTANQALAAEKKPAPVRLQSTQSEKGTVSNDQDGTVEINVTDVLGNDLPSRVELQEQEGVTSSAIEVPNGRAQARVSAGKYTAYVYVYADDVPFLVDAKKIEIRKGQTEFVLTELLEGASGGSTLFQFDKDHDLAIDSVELACKTDPADAASIPGRKTIPCDERVLNKESRWYRGELNAFSEHSIGKESVEDLVKRAEKLKLDFLAITDQNTVAACYDKKWKSDSVVLLPALEWGSDERGYSLIYGPRTFVPFVDSFPQAQALVALVQAQGGFFAAAHPCFPTSPWQWALSYINGVEVWCREWNRVPPMSLDMLNEDMKVRDKEKKLIHSVAFAAASATAASEPMGTSAPLLSANGQAAIFYDSELVRGLKAAAIGGSHTASPDVPMAEPVTYVFATEKSVNGILDGMRRGRTFISSGLNGPKMLFYADALKDGSVDVSIGGVLPVGIPVKFEVVVDDARVGDQVQILINGHTAISKNIEQQGTFVFRFEHTTESYAVYRARVTRGIEKDGLLSVDTVAMTSPIYAQLLDIAHPKLLEYAEKKYMEKQQAPQEINLPDPSKGEIIPQWKF